MEYYAVFTKSYDSYDTKRTYCEKFELLDELKKWLKTTPETNYEVVKCTPLTVSIQVIVEAEYERF